MVVSRLDQASRWLTLAMLGLAAIAFVLAPVLALSWSAKPFLGFVVEQTLVVAGYDGQGWSGPPAGINHPQRVVQLGEQVLESRADFYQAIDALSVGQQISISTVLRDGTARTYDAVVSRFPTVDLLRLFGVPYAVGLAYLLVGAAVYRFRGSTGPGRAFAFFCASTALVSGLLFDLITTHTLSPLWMVAIAMEGSAMLSLALLFPEEWQPLRHRAWLRYLPYLVTTALALWGLLVLNNVSNAWDYILAWRASYIYAAFGIAVFLGVMLYRQRASTSPVARQQARIIWWGSLSAFVPVGIWLVAPLLGINIRFIPLLFLPFMLGFPLSIAVAILRYRLWDVGFIINRTMVYGALTMILGLIYYATVVGLQQLLPLSLANSPQLAVAASTLATAALFHPVRRRVQETIDRRFDRHKYNAAQTLSSFSTTLRTEVNLVNLTERLESVIWETLQPAHVFTWLHSAGCFRPFFGDEVAREWIKTEVPSDDPLIGHFNAASGVVDLERVVLDSRALADLKSAGVKIVVPLISQSELIGWLSLGPRLSERDYSADDRVLLWNLGTQTGPAVRVAQLVRQQQDEALQRERFEHQMRVARVIQQTLLPQEPPALPGWQVAVHYQPAGAVGGDFYDFLHLPDGRLFITIGDVTDKGVPAALVMASTRSILRGTARRMLSPSAALAQANELLYPELPPSMFVTCLFALVDPVSGRMQYANAGHNLPIRFCNDGITQLYATGMPLGLLPDVRYEERETTIEPGERLIFYSDGLTEAHNVQNEMFGTARLHAHVQNPAASGLALIQSLLDALVSFTGPDWQQEDDVTLLTLSRADSDAPESSGAERESQEMLDDTWEIIDEFALTSEPGNERVAMERVAVAAKDWLSPSRLERLKTAVAEATLNAIEHGNQFRADLKVHIQLLISDARNALAVRITDQAQGGTPPGPPYSTPNLEAKLSGQETPRGWGLFLIRNMVDEMHASSAPDHHSLELILYREDKSNLNRNQINQEVFHD